MNIAVNTRLLLPNCLEGIGIFSCETLKRIVACHPEHHFFFIFDRPHAPEFIFADNVTPITAFPPARHPYLWHLFFEYAIPKILKKVKADLFLSPDGYLSLRTPVKSVAVIHDLNFEHHPEFMKPSYLGYLQRNFPKFAQRAARIATVSQFSKEDIINTYQQDANKIDVVYNGCNDAYKPLSQNEQNAVRQKYTNGCDYFLFVGSIHRRKNLGNMLRAFEQFKNQNATDAKFVIVGSKMWRDNEIGAVLAEMRHKDDVLLMGRQQTELLSKLMGAASALLYVSFFEGFGIPVLEAFHAETAVITSNVTSLPEVAGEAALQVSPHSAEAIAEAMSLLYYDKTLRSKLIHAGRQQRQHFSWEQSAALLWETLMQALKRGA
ncbi:MAG: glycosyltransferase family 4 protein [Bacteroidales bacterium]|jgi:glycosyltransferase involved in cell wall biosynthesis|nr:glycosyltransferase family 4 protein [Bacteroidales bacterium]